MPEGDTILRIKQQLDDALVGQVLAVCAPSARGRAAGVERLDGALLDRIDTHGKHLMLRFGDLVLHSHLGMSGSWQLYRLGERWRRPRSSAWVVLSGELYEAAQFGGPTLRVLPARRLALDPQLTRLGPDILAPGFSAEQSAAAFRAIDQRRTLGEALLDQHLVAGIGNIFKSEACFAVRIDPWRALAAVTDDELRAVLLSAREQMLDALTGGRRAFSVYNHRGPCVGCGGRVVSRGQGDANRTTWWCEGCQR
jgi:endonuclease VIII